MSETPDSTLVGGGSLRDLQGSFAGELVRVGDAGYDTHRRVWNGSIDRRPGLIARCTGVADVQVAVRFSRQRGLLTAVRGGGHSFPGLSTCDGGLLIDLGLMKEIRVNPEARTARVEPGTLLGELDAATQPFGLAVPAGIVTHTGVAGLTLGGGIGWIQRKYGLTIDQLLSVKMVTAEGELVRASENENADLFWGVRGGGGNFGIVTEFEFRAVPLSPTVMAGPVFWLMEDAEKVLHFYRDWIADCPDELMTIVMGACSACGPGGTGGQTGGRGGRLLRRARRGGREDPATSQSVRVTGPRPVSAQAVRHPSRFPRRFIPSRRLVLRPLL